MVKVDGTSGSLFNSFRSSISYGIILYKAHQSSFGLNKEFLARLLQDENAQYFLVSLVWATAAPIKGITETDV